MNDSPTETPQRDYGPVLCPDRSTDQPRGESADSLAADNLKVCDSEQNKQCPFPAYSILKCHHLDLSGWAMGAVRWCGLLQVVSCADPGKGTRK